MNTQTVSAPRKRIVDSRSDRIFYLVTNLLMGSILLVILYPLIYVLSSSFSSGEAILSGKVLLWPVDLSLQGYQMVFRYDTVVSGYANSIFYTVAGTVISVAITMICAYPLARRTLPFRTPLMLMFTFTMYFSGGLIPTYLQVRALGLLNSRWAMLIPTALSVYNMIIARSFIQSSIPEELIEASQIDGCNDFRFFFTMLLPLSKALIAVLVLYYAVAKWNAWYNAFIYLNDRDMYPLQLILREILIANQLDTASMDDPELAQLLQETATVMKYSLIVVASVPMLILYPFIQKFFVTGVMIGSVKG